MSRRQWCSIYLSLVVLCVGVLWLDARKTKQCGSSDIAQHGSCHREGHILEDISRRCRMVLSHHSIRDTPWVKNVKARWDGSVHQLVDTGSGAPAVTTEKSDIRLCLDTVSSRDAQVFVCLHELSHIAVDSYGHTPEFWTCFTAFVDAAVATGVYTHPSSNAEVCGTPIGPRPGR